MRDGGAELEAMIKRIREIPNLARRAAPDAAKAVRGVLVEQIAEGTSPTGERWAPRKADGGRALANAGDALTVAPLGTRIFCKLSGVEARHDSGRVKGGTIRKILPGSGIPPKMADAIGEVLDREFARVTKGGA
jgi:hypothetical protein